MNIFWLLAPNEDAEGTPGGPTIYPRRLLLGVQDLIVISGGAPRIELGARQ